MALTLGLLSARDLRRRLALGLDLRTGPFRFLIRSRREDVARGLERLYPDFPLEVDGFRDFHVRVDAVAGLRRCYKPQCNFWHDEHAPFKPLPLNHAFPLLEWGMNWCIAGYAQHYLMLHAAVLERRGRAVILPGDPGAGKSTLINRWVPRAQVLTQEISSALNSGKHTTTSTTLYWMDAAKTTALIDSPGFQEFGLHHIAPMQLAQLMPDIAAQAGDCKFYNCSHLHEPGCGVLHAVQHPSTEASISTTRFKIYNDLFAELSQTRY